MTRIINKAAAGTLAILLCAQVLADEEQAAAKAPELALAAFEAATPLTETELTEQRAMAKLEIERISINETDQDGDVNSNTAIGNTTGGNSITGNAFAGSDGFTSSVQNTGNNVLIQNATTINVSVEQ